MFYFAYGSNMNWPQMQRRCPSSRFVCAARLPGYRLAIARHSRLRDCGTANIFRDSDSDVWGIVYEVSDNDMLTMDEFEDGYERQTAAVYSADKHRTPLQVIFYIAPKEIHAPSPNAEYKRLMLEGARHWKLPSDYCLRLERILESFQ
jgi:gamma-glutamylcyclotransferase